MEWHRESQQSEHGDSGSEVGLHGGNLLYFSENVGRILGVLWVEGSYALVRWHSTRDQARGLQHDIVYCRRRRGRSDALPRRLRVFQISGKGIWNAASIPARDPTMSPLAHVLYPRAWKEGRFSRGQGLRLAWKPLFLADCIRIE